MATLAFLEMPDAQIKSLASGFGGGCHGSSFAAAFSNWQKYPRRIQFEGRRRSRHGGSAKATGEALMRAPGHTGGDDRVPNSEARIGPLWPSRWP